MLRQRLFFGTILIVALLALLYADHRLSESMSVADGILRFDGLIVTLVAAVLVLLGAAELNALLRAAGHAPLALWPTAVSIVLVALPWLNHSGLLNTPAGHTPPLAQWTAGCIAAAFFGVSFFVASDRRIEGATARIAVSLLPVIYLGLLAQFIVLVRLEAHGGVGLLLYYVATVKLCDIGAYFTGLAIGRHKFIPWLSPKKTWEGFFGGIAASMLFATGISWRMGGGGDAATSALPGVPMACVFGLLMAVVGQGGDLLESLFKREAAAKDSASAIPAFGGVLDILDSILPTAPVAYLLLIQCR